MITIRVSNQNFLHASFYDLLRTQEYIGRIEIIPKNSIGVLAKIEGYIDVR